MGRCRETGSLASRGVSRRRTLALVTASFALALSHSALADKGEDDDADDDNKHDGKTLAQKAAARFPQPVAVGALLGRKVLQPSESQPILGTVKAIVRTRDRTIEAVIAYGGFLGFGTRPIAIPIDAMALLSPELEVVEYDPEDLDKFSNFDPAGAEVLAPDTIIQVGLAKPSH